jgi:hypothetical protein
VKSDTVRNDGDLVKLVRLLLILVVCIGAALTVVTHIAQLGGISFSAYSIAGLCAAVIVSVLVLWGEVSRDVFLTVRKTPSAALWLLLCAVGGALLSLACYRPDPDDADYVPNVIYYLEHPGEPMDFYIHYLDSGGEPFLSHHLSTSLPFEQAQGVLAYFVHVHFLTVYYFVAPALFGFMIPLVWFYLISRFSFAPRAAVTGALFICLSLVLFGEQHRSFGNFAFNRIYQGKTVLLAVWIPLFAALTIDFFKWPSARRWLYLFITSVAAVGLSNSASVLIPVLAGVLTVACCVSYVPSMKSRLLFGFCYLSTLVYPALYAGTILLLSLNQVCKDSIINRKFSLTFLGHFKYVFGPVALAFFIIATIGAIILVRRRERGFLIIWILLLTACCLNPLVAPFFIKYITGPNIYWRLFYLLPFPLVVGLAAAGLTVRLEALGPRRRDAFIQIVVILFLLAHLPASSSSVFNRVPENSRKTKVYSPRYKVPHLPEARRFLSLSPPPGTMLSPPSIARPLVMLTSRYPQICIRHHAILVWMPQRSTHAEAKHRIRARNFLGGETQKENLDSLIWVIRQHPQIRTVVASHKSAKARDRYLFKLLEEYGFSEHRQTEQMVLFIRAGTQAEREFNLSDEARPR